MPEYDQRVFQAKLKLMLDGRNCFKVAHAIGLDYMVLRHYFLREFPSRPTRDACIVLADYFGISPNEMLEAAGYESLHFPDDREMSSDVNELVATLQQIESKSQRQRVARALNNLALIYCSTSPSYLTPAARGRDAERKRKFGDEMESVLKPGSPMRVRLYSALTRRRLASFITTETTITTFREWAEAVVADDYVDYAYTSDFTSTRWSAWLLAIRNIGNKSYGELVAALETWLETKAGG